MKKSFYTIDEQIEHLINNGIIITSVDKVKKILERHSYYNIINGYNVPFLFRRKPKKYINNLEFTEIYALYDFDDKVRNIIFPYLLIIENAIKTETIYAFSNSRDKQGHLINHDADYLKIDRYDNRNIKKSFDVIVDFEKIIAKYLESSDAIKHYLTTYNYVPLWVLSTFMTFGDVSKFYAVMKMNDRQAVSKKYNLPENELRVVLKVLTLIRNCCAHRNRLYCFKHSYTLPVFAQVNHPQENYFTSRGLGNKNLFSIIICMSLMLPHKQMKSLVNAIKNELVILSNKLKVIKVDIILDFLGFPKDWEKIVV